MKNFLITGITGFVGSHLADYLLDNNLGNVSGMKRWRSPLDNIEHIYDDIKLYDCDLRDLKSMIITLKKVKPDIIFHLAAQSYVQTSYDAPSDTIFTNTIGTVNLLDAVMLAEIDPVIVVSSTSEVYGNVTEGEIPIKETNPMNPISPYALSKVGEDRAAFMYNKAYGLKTVISRMFTHSGPRRGEVFFISSFAKQIAEIECGKNKDNVVKVGNLHSIRTIADVRDAVEAYWLLATKCDYGEVYNIGGNTTQSVGTILEILIAMSTVNDIRVEVDPERLRPADATLQIPDTTKFRDKTGWKPKIDLITTLKDTLNYWRERIY